MTTPHGYTPPPSGFGGHRPAATALYGPHLDGDAMPALYEDLRRTHGPVAPVTVAPGIEAWLVLGHRELLRVARDEQDFSHDPRRWSPLREGRVPPDSPILPFVGWRPALMFADGQQHRRMRAAVSEALARIDGHELRRRVRSAAEELIASFAGRGAADLVPQYARRLPLLVISGLLGLDERPGRRLVHAIGRMGATASDSGRASRRINAILLALIEEKRSRPGDDITSALLHHPARLTDEEVLHNLLVMFVAGHQSTVDWIATSLCVMLCDPAFPSAPTGGRLTADDALDLVLWRFPPTQNLPTRYATRALRLGGQSIRAGDMLILGLAAANADPAVLPPGGPAAGNRSHLAFGAGPHTCPAQDPARVITRTAVDTVRQRLPDMELAVEQPELAWVPSPWRRGLAALPVRFTGPQPSRTAPADATGTGTDRPGHPAAPQTGEVR
ncbi:cytochrome P450 [Streptomyces tirandamycinicus]|uniref:cytochrome P450 n=1 Tax=Streptomyces tirandamycinicus TaxID=2174846 RepID=UPI00226F441E|nr:cytochrome P450 [Streptomyces tirandamycinicus]MCY0985081.1 cytochrome P450 [Streptomyces tirandamycinicus]